MLALWRAKSWEACSATYSNLLGFVVCTSGQGNADGAVSDDLPVQDHHQDLVRRSPRLLQGLVGFLDQLGQLLQDQVVINSYFPTASVVTITTTTKK